MISDCGKCYEGIIRQSFLIINKELAGKFALEEVVRKDFPKAVTLHPAGNID